MGIVEIIIDDDDYDDDDYDYDVACSVSVLSIFHELYHMYVLREFCHDVISV